jgi:hypothetical protein
VAFDTAGATDLAIGPAETWAQVRARFPASWQPDFIALYLPYTSIPSCLWSAPLPLVGLAADWNLHWHHYRRCLDRCDLVLTDTRGVETLERAGIRHARPANLFGCEQAYLDGPWPKDARDIDILFVGNLSPAVQRERLPWLGRLAQLAERWRIVIRNEVYGDAYRALLARARIVFNQSIRSECNRRVFEAAAAGALLFQEAGNREVPDYFRDGLECVYYTDDNLEWLLDYYLDHEDERRALAEAAHQHILHYSFPALWQSALDVIEREWSAVIERCRERLAGCGPPHVLARLAQALGSDPPGDPALARDVATALARQTRDAGLHHALGLATAIAANGLRGISAAVAEQAAGCFRRALASAPGHALAGLNLAEALMAVGQKEAAADQARRTLAVLNQPVSPDADWLDSGHFPPGFDLFRVEWERAAWANAGRPAAEARAKTALLRWRLHTLLADVNEELLCYHEAAVARPDLAVTRAALGCALARAKRFGEAVVHLRAAVEANPFDRLAARALFDVLGASGDLAGQRRLARERRWLAQAAPQVVPEEAWFMTVPPVGDELASLIILCCNELDYTRECLESVLAHTRAAYELILVDNGSHDGTPAYLEEIKTHRGPARVVVIRNETNRGYAVGCNQGLAAARGCYLVLLNNDTVVTPHWLDGLVTWALHDWPHVGLVGPVTNCAAPPQEIPVEYRNAQDLAAFAARRRTTHKGQALVGERLIGFCLLLRREVLERIGGQLD